MSQFHDEAISVSRSQVFRIKVFFRPTKFDAHGLHFCYIAVLYTAKSSSRLSTRLRRDFLKLDQSGFFLSTFKFHVRSAVLVSQEC